MTGTAVVMLGLVFLLTGVSWILMALQGPRRQEAFPFHLAGNYRTVLGRMSEMSKKSEQGSWVGLQIPSGKRMRDAGNSYFGQGRMVGAQ